MAAKYALDKLCAGEFWHTNGIAEGSQMIVTMSVTDGVLVELGGYLSGTRDEK